MAEPAPPTSPGRAFGVFAPGKLVLVGEYAVVDGAPAIALAIDRGVVCAVRPGGEGVRVETPGDDRFVRPALAGAPAGLYRFADAEPPALDGGDKPGFGGSAAACVAACLAAGRPAEDAFAIHRAVQGGGSGVDVATSIAGGMVRFEGGRTRPLVPVRPVVAWSGASARTGPRVARYLAWRGRRAFVDESAAIVEDFPRDPVRALARAHEALARMARAAGVDWLTPSLARIAELARDCGGAAKPSGAGGGDCAVALFDDDRRRRRFLARLREEGLRVVPVEVAPGARRVALGPRRDGAC